MGKSDSTIEDFILDPEFKSWVLFPSKESDARWEAYLKVYPENAIKIETAKKVLLKLETLAVGNSGISLKKTEKDYQWERISSKLPGVQVKNETDVVSISSNAIIQRANLGKKEHAYRIWAVLAACFIGFFVASFLYFNINENENDPVEIPEKWVTHHNPAGVKSSLRLSDGSMVYLNSNSSIKYLDGFSGKSRMVLLEGEAFFEVEKDSLKPFIVHSGNVSTKALGTSFNIKVSLENAVQVSLVTGKVEVENLSDFEIEHLLPGEEILAIEESFEKREFNKETRTAWMYKTLIIEDQNWASTIHELENWFGVRFEVANLPGSVPAITAKYEDENLQNILEGLSYKLNFKYSINGKTVQITF